MRSELARQVRSFSGIGLVTALTVFVPALHGATKPLSVASLKGAEAMVQMTNQVFIYPSLPRATEIPDLAPLVATADALPKRTWKVRTVDGEGNAALMAVHEWGSGTNSNVIVLIHGLLADHTVWTPVAGELGHDHDLWLIDLPGMGDSEAPVAPDKVGEHGYAPTTIANRLWQVIADRLRSRPNPPRLTVVGHSLGGLITLRMFADPDLRERYQQARQQVGGLLVLSPPDVVINKAMPEFISIAKITGLELGVGSALGIVREKLAQAVLDGFATTNRATREFVDMAIHNLSDRTHRRATQAMIWQVTPFTKELRPRWQEIDILEAQYANVTEPCLIVFGDRDETLPTAMGYKIASQITGARLVILKQCMHYVHAEHPDKVAALLRDFEHGRSQLFVRKN